MLFLAGEEELDGLQAAGMDESDEIVLRPWSVDALRWRIEAMAIRAQVPTSQSNDAVLSGGGLNSEWTPAAPVFVVFNPKGGVGKTTIATNLAAVLQLRKQMQVLLIDADTVTGHVGLSLGLSGGRSAVDSWTDEDGGYPHESLLDIAQTHSSGIRVVSLATDPLRHPTLKGERVGDAIAEARHLVDAIVVDLHPSYSEVNLAAFAIADRILLPVTPDLPAIRAAIQLKEVAVEIGVRDRLSLVINRANSGVTVQDMEETIGLQAMAHIRSAGPALRVVGERGQDAHRQVPAPSRRAGLRAPRRPAHGGPLGRADAGAASDRVAPQEPLRPKGHLAGLARPAIPGAAAPTSLLLGPATGGPEAFRELGERLHDDIGLGRILQARLDPGPRPASHEDGQHARRGGRPNVVVHPVTDVGDGVGRRG